MISTLFDQVSNRIRLLRIMKKMTQADVAGIAGVSLLTYQNYENGKNDIPSSVLLKLSGLYYVPIDILLHNDDVLEEFIIELDKQKK